MKLKDVELLPGVIIKVDDDKKVGRVKANVPTLFDTTNDNMEVDGLPWIYPLTMFGQQHFSKMFKGEKIWVLKTENNYQEFWYLPMVEYTEQTINIIDDYANAEVLMSRELGDNKVLVYYNDTDGIMINVGQNSLINITNDTTIKIKSGDAEINLKDNKVYIGSETGTQKTVLGNNIETLLRNLATNLASAGAKASANCYTSPIGPDLTKAAMDLNMNMSDLFTKNTFLS